MDVGIIKTSRGYFWEYFLLSTQVFFYLDETTVGREDRDIKEDKIKYSLFIPKDQKLFTQRTTVKTLNTPYNK